MEEQELHLVYQIKQSWTDLITSEVPKYLLTITIKKARFGISDSSFLSLINRLIYFTNSSLYRKRYARGEQFLEGFAALEHQGNENPHIHFIITSDISIGELRTAIMRHLNKFPQITKIGVDVRPINDSDNDYWRVINYLRKECRDFFILSKDGLLQ